MLQCVIRKLQNIAFYEQNKIHTSFRLLLYLSYICRCLSNNFLLYGPLLFFSILIYQILCKYPYCTLYTRTLHLLTSQFNSNGHCSFFFFINCQYLPILALYHSYPMITIHLCQIIVCLKTFYYTCMCSVLF